MKKVIIALIMMTAVMALSGQANAFTIDGLLNDWGVTPGVYGASDWTPNDGIMYTVEDQNTYYLNPGYGGQKFDAEAMYGKIDGDKFYIAIVTGMPMGGYGGELPGDIFLDLGNNNIYGIKTIGADKGKLFKGASWNDSPYWPASKFTTMISGTGTDLGLIDDYFYGYTYATGEHYVLEMAISTSLFGSDWQNKAILQWTETCGNDVIGLTVHTPEPATMIMMGIGLLGAGALRRRKK
jgi:hypothetical protein